MLQTTLNYSLEQHPVKHSTTYLELKLIQMVPISCNIFMVLCATEREIFRNLQPCARLQTCARDTIGEVQLRTIKLDNFDANKTRFFWLSQIVGERSKPSIKHVFVQ
jgi:hypothetical protein